jgi:aldehyde:ferredoxin oxidoreductase
MRSFPEDETATAVTGQEPDENYLMGSGASVLKREKGFNEAAGFTSKDDRLPEFFFKEPLSPSGLTFDNGLSRPSIRGEAKLCGRVNQGQVDSVACSGQRQG